MFKKNIPKLHGKGVECVYFNDGVQCVCAV